MTTHTKHHQNIVFMTPQPRGLNGAPSKTHLSQDLSCDTPFASANSLSCASSAKQAKKESIQNRPTAESTVGLYHRKEDKRITKMTPNTTEFELYGVGENHYLKKKIGKKNRKLKEMKAKNRGYKPHFGPEDFAFLTESFADISKVTGVEVPDELWRKIEGVVALFINLKECTTYTQFTAGIFLYVRDFYESSITKEIMDYISNLLNDSVFEKQDGPDETTPNWIKMLRNIKDNWALVKSNKAFGQFSKLMGLLVTLGMCDAAALQFEIAGFKVFDSEITKKHMSAFDVAEALLGTVTYFVEGAYLCFKTGSIKPLLLNDFAVLELDEEFTNIITWWELVKNGNLHRTVGMEDSEFIRRLDAVIVKLSTLVMSLKGLDKKLVVDKLTRCKGIRNELTILKISSGTRRSPFAFELFGESSMGKTTFGDQLTDALLTSAGLSTDKTYRAALNPGDKYFSNWTSDKTVAILDDVANEKSNFVEKPPTRAIIDICNNQMYYAPKAELEAKGKCFVEPEIVSVTTNVKDLDARVYSNCPYSVQRRMDLVFTVKCKPEFQKIINGKCCGVDSSAVRRYYTVDGEYKPPPIDDIWTLDIEQAVAPEELRTTATYAPVTWRGQEMKDVSPVVAIQCAIEAFTEHRENQYAIMESMKTRERCLEVCSKPGCRFLKGMCPDHYDNQLGFETAVAINRIRKMFSKRFEDDSEAFSKRIENAVTTKLYNTATNFLDKWDWMCVIPSKYFENEKVIDFLEWYYGDQLFKASKARSWILYSLTGIIAYVSWRAGILFFMFSWLIHNFVGINTKREILVRELRRRNDTLPNIVKNARDKYAEAICYTSATIAALYAISKVYGHYRKLRESHSGLEPKTQEEVDKRDAQANVWTPVVKRELPTSNESKCCSADELASIVKKQLRYATLRTEKRKMMANILFIRSNVVVLPDHYFEDTEFLDVKACRDEANALGGSFESKLHKAASVAIPDTDLRLCYCPSGGTFRDIVKYFPVGEVVSHPFQMLYRMKDGDVLEACGLGVAEMCDNEAKQFMGVDYKNLTINTFAGMCGAVLISKSKAAAITGFHLGGHAGTPHGCAGSLMQMQIYDALSKLEKIEGVVLSGVASKFQPQSLGVTVMKDDPLHPKSPINYLPIDSQFVYYGSCVGQTTSRSDVRRTPISEHVAEICGVQNKWGAPKMKPEWFGWQTCLENASKPGKAFPHDLLTASILDYKRPLLELIRLPMWNKIKPLTDLENLCGIPGCKFIDAINLNTSIGFPLTGPKRKFVTELEPTPEQPNNRILDDVIMDEIARVEGLYKEGKRAYTIAKACKKDEVLPVAKGKCRIFYGNPITLTFLVRKYYLPILRFLQMNPLKSECAVGINCHGPEWEEFYTHATHFGSDRYFGGDYGKYDQKLPSQLLFASLRILMDLARECNYSEEDIGVMQAMTGDLVYAMIAVNGDLIGLQEGTHISGNSLTVILNGICGSLNLRNFFYTRYPLSIPFRDAVHIMTYGDDNIGSVSPDYPEFNIKGCSEFLASYGQVYTMPDKESELKAYLDPNDFEFLKRKSYYHSGIGQHVGALLEDSIFKSLHCYMRPKGSPLTPQEACAQNIDGAMREWFNHGYEVYEKRREQMQQVAEKAGIRHLCTSLDSTYTCMVGAWCQKYDPAYQGSGQVEEKKPYKPQSGDETEDRSLYLQTAFDVKMALLATDCVVCHSTLGEIDMVFEKLQDGIRHILIVEVKGTTNNRHKGISQVKKYASVVKLLQPHASVMGVLVTPTGMTVHYFDGFSLSGWFAIAANSSEVFQECVAHAALDF